MTDDKTKTSDKTDKPADSKDAKPAVASTAEVKTEKAAETKAAEAKPAADKKEAVPATAEKKPDTPAKADAATSEKKPETPAKADTAKAEDKDKKEEPKAEAAAPAKAEDKAEKKEAADDKEKDKAEAKTEAKADDKSDNGKVRAKIDPAEAHVLVVEDNVPNFVLIARMLAYMGVQRCEWKTSGWQVVEFADTLPRIDLVLMDIRLPYEDGFQALEKLRSHPRLKETLVIAVTAEASVEQMNRAKDSGFDGFLGKPLDPDRFPEQIKRVLNGEAVWEMH